MDRSGIFETLIGAFVIVIAALFAYYAYNVSGQAVGRDQYQLGAVFGRVDGVAVGAEVRIAGIKVGSVTGNALNPETYEANLNLAISSGVPIPEDSIAKIVSDGLLGGAHVAIEPGAAEEVLRDGDVITITQGSVDLLGLAVQAFTSPQGGGAADDGNTGQTELEPLGDF